MVNQACGRANAKDMLKDNVKKPCVLTKVRVNVTKQHNKQTKHLQRQAGILAHKALVLLFFSA